MAHVEAAWKGPIIWMGVFDLKVIMRKGGSLFLFRVTENLGGGGFVVLKTFTYSDWKEEMWWKSVYA